MILNATYDGALELGYIFFPFLYRYTPLSLRNLFNLPRLCHVGKGIYTKAIFYALQKRNTSSGG